MEAHPRHGDRQRRSIEGGGRQARPQHIADIDDRGERARRKYDERQQKLTLAALAPAQVPAPLLADVNRGHGWRAGPANQSSSSLLNNQASLCPDAGVAIAELSTERRINP